MDHQPQETWEGVKEALPETNTALQKTGLGFGPKPYRPHNFPPNASLTEAKVVSW